MKSEAEAEYRSEAYWVGTPSGERRVRRGVRLLQTAPAINLDFFENGHILAGTHIPAFYFYTNMLPKNSEVSWMKKGNAIAVVVVIIALLYVWQGAKNPKVEPDRTVTSTGITVVTTTGTSSDKPVPVLVSPTTKPEPVAMEPVTATKKPSPAVPEKVAVIPAEDPEGASDIPPSPVNAETAPPKNPATPSNSGATQSGIITYYNNYLDYGLSLPRGSYYAGYGGKDGAAHTMGFATGTGVTSFDEASVKLWYFPNKLLPELKNGENTFYQDPGSNMTYLKLGNGTVKIQGNMEDPIVLKIIETVNRGD